jgi:hypothetical protein
MSSLTPWSHGPLTVASNGRFIEHTDGTPFFWLGDTGWLLFSRLDRNEAATYLDDRKAKGFNVIQVMMVHRLPCTNIFGRGLPGLEDIDWQTGPSMSHPDDYWSVIDEITGMAEERGLYLAMVPVWGTLVDEGRLTVAGAAAYGAWLGHKFRDRPNIIWLNGGDVRGDLKLDVWEALGSAIKEHDPNHIMTFHPFGRARSSEWFHESSWLDFNMFQSGHRRYDQMSLEPTGGANNDDPETNAKWKGEDNWRYVLEDLALEPTRPTIDGEPSYEGAPQGLHDGTQPIWIAADARRYGYWSVFAGAFGHTYGNNAVMQMHKPQFEPGAFSVTSTWDEAISDPGAGQMQHLRNLMLALDHGHGRHSPGILVGDPGKKYDRLIANTGPDYAVVYAFTPRPVVVDLIKALPEVGLVSARWFYPATGKYSEIGSVPSTSDARFNPEREKAAGNDIVLVLTP